jgi:hypothetical protein
MRYRSIAVLTLTVAGRTLSGQEAQPASQQPANREIALSLISDAKTGSILVEGKLEQHPVVMILDTGAAQTIFDAEDFGISPVDLQVARVNQRGVGLDANFVWREADFSVGDLRWIQKKVAIANLKDISRIYGKKIDGIVGEDILREFKSVTINYKWGCVMLTK